VLFSVSQRSLHRRRFQLLDRPLERASLFPFFDASGAVSELMLVSEEGARIQLSRWRPGLFTRGWLRPHRLDLRSSQLQDVTRDDAEERVELLHFDPWWVLSEPRYAGHPAVPALRHTNIPGYDGEITRMYFDDRLSRVTHLGRGDAEALQLHQLKPDDMAAIARTRGRSPRPATSSGLRQAARWRLRPFWERPGADRRRPIPSSWRRPG
jgi:hypothetical protein